MTATVTSPSDHDAGGKETSGAGGARKKPRIPGRLRRIGLPYLLLLPAILFELLVHVVPMVVGVVISFRQLTLFFIHNWGAAPWSGLQNFKIALDFNSAVGKSLLHSFLITILFTVLSVGLCWVFGTSAAIMLQDKFRGRGVLRTIFLVPYALPVYAAVITWAFMFQHDNGMVNHLLHDQLHLTDSASFWLIGNNSFYTLLIVSLWKGWPFAFLIVMAGLQNIPSELYEAASIDGAGIWQQIRKITLPSLRSVNQVLVLVLFLWTFNDFNTPFVLFGKNGNAPGSADLISFHIYQSSFSSWNFGSGSAMSVLLLLFLLVVTGIYLALTTQRERSKTGVGARRSKRPQAVEAPQAELVAAGAAGTESAAAPAAEAVSVSEAAAVPAAVDSSEVAAAAPAEGAGTLPDEAGARDPGSVGAGEAPARELVAASSRSPMAPPLSFLWSRGVLLTILVLFTLLPVYVMVSSSLKPLEDVQGKFTWIPSHLTIRPYIDIWSTVPLAKFFVNSAIVSVSATACSVVIAVFAAYAVSRYRFRGKRLFTVTVLSTQMFPGILFLLPLYLIFVNIGKSTGIDLYGSRGGLIITYLTFSLPFAIWMLIGYFDSVPRDLDEAAMVDGCGPFGALFRVVVPAAVPGIVAVAVYAFMTAWGEVLFASVMTNDNTKTLAIGLQSYSTENNVYWNQIMAASLVVSVPVVVGFLLLQRYLVTGLTAGAVK